MVAAVDLTLPYPAVQKAHGTSRRFVHLCGNISDDVVVMNSKFRLRDLATDEVQIVVLCYPDAVGSSSGYVSALDPIGCAVLGCRVGDEIVSRTPIGARRFKLIEVLY